jgi:hypothetical protein
VLDRAIALAPGEIEIGHGYVVLEIDEGLLRIARRADGLGRLGFCGEADRADVLSRGTGYKSLRCLVPIQLAARLHVEVNHRCEPASHSHQIAGKAALYPANRGGE